jgi:hypothetical protein
MYRLCSLMWFCVGVFGCRAVPEDSANPTATVSMSGVSYQFMTHIPLGGARVHLEEFPELSTTSDANGNFIIEGIPLGAMTTPYVELEDHRRSYHQRFQADHDLQQVYLQLIPGSIYDQLAILLSNMGHPVNEEACQVVSTVCSSSMAEVSDFEAFLEHGDAGLLEGAIASLTPASGELLYFNELVQPDPDLETTSSDGGVLWLNVEPGSYLMNAMVPDREEVFPDVVVDCESGRFINASPPWGLTAQPAP